jgi:uncharacterized Zn-finger protein
MPQYTLTLDGNTLKSGQIQYKIENTAPQTQIIAKESQNQQMTVDEFLKLNKNQVVLKKNPTIEEKNKKPKFNLILQASPQKQQQVKAQQSPAKPQIQIHNIEKILPSNPPAQQPKQLVVPIMVRNDGTRNDAAQIISQALSSSVENKQQANPPFAYVQMKIQPNADGQLTLTPASALPQPQHLQLSLSPQQLQQLSFQAPTAQQQPAPALTVQQPQITVTQVQSDNQTQTQTKSESQDDEEMFETHYEDDYYMENSDEGEEKALEVPATKTFIIKKTQKPNKVMKKIKSESLTELQEVSQEHSDMAKKQLNMITSFNAKRVEETTEKPADLNLTVCDVCKKVFKRKEFLMQHLKSHIGLRPFKCDEPTCNKSFSRKEHLLRHVVSHTGKKMFTCDVCNKLFSRKDNLNKHRR